MLRFLSSALFLPLSAQVLVLAAGQQMPRYTMDPDNDLGNMGNNRYTVNLTIAGTVVNAFIDTGSTDLWVDPPAEIGAFHSTGVAAKLDFGDGSTFVNGTVGLAEVEIAGAKVPAQAFVNVTQNPSFQGEFGLVGLSFDGVAKIPGALAAAHVNGAAVVGKSFLSSVFDQNPEMGRFFGLSLSRLYDPADSADASLDIAQLDERYTAVQNSPVLPQFPANNSQWSVLTDGIQVNGVPIPWPANTKTTPAGQNSVLLDSGTTNFLLPAAIRDAIYSAVPGAVLAQNSSIPNPHFSADRDVWIVPCQTVIQMSTSFGGQSIPIHPLDLTDMTVVAGPDDKEHTICVGSITNGGTITTGPGSFDGLFGDSFLRNAYTLFSFGNDTTPPHVQLLSVTPNDAATDFLQTRATALSTAPPELSPAAIIALFDGASALSADGRVSTNLAAADAASTTDSQVSKYAPVIIGLLGANLILLVLLAILGVVGCLRS
ncbi:aspartic peptidase domain-containing protein [Mycena polygramma]|nr:aspartic peptidase domain-containing protein [Mycena polygramma]